LCEVLLQMGLILNELKDVNGAISTFNSAINLITLQDSSWDEPGLKSVLARIYANLSSAYQNSGNYETGCSAGLHALDLYQQLNESEPSAENLDGMSAVSINLAINFYKNRQFEKADKFYNQAITALELLAKETEDPGIIQRLSIACMNRSNLARASHQIDFSLELLDHSIALTEKLYMNPGNSELTHDLALQYMNRGITLQLKEDYSRALESYDKALKFRELALLNQGRKETRHELAKTLTNKAILLNSMNQSEESHSLHQRAIEILETMIFEEGRSELLHQLALTCISFGEDLESCGQVGRMNETYGKGLDLLKYLIRDNSNDTLKALYLKYSKKRDEYSSADDKFGIC
jgi:tetratricopeptide (TPR) repeat protein